MGAQRTRGFPTGMGSFVLQDVWRYAKLFPRASQAGSAAGLVQVRRTFEGQLTTMATVLLVQTKFHRLVALVFGLE